MTHCRLYATLTGAAWCACCVALWLCAIVGAMR
jgi:hypothetical protein